MSRPTSLAFSIVLTSLAAGCGAEVSRDGAPVLSSPSTPDAGPRGSVTQALWSPSVRRVVVEVDYGPNAAPYVGTVAEVGNLWSIFDANARRLFQGSGKTFTIPTTLGQMQRIDVAAREFTADDLLALSRRNRNVLPTADTASVHVMVLDGWFRDASGRRRTDMLGGHLDGTSVIVLFKPVIAGTAVPGQPQVAMVVEQTTLVHEFGHAVGMVDNGVAAVAGNADREHARHCTNARCVMNAYNEGAGAAQAFVRRYAMTRDPVLFGAECLANAAAAIAAAR